MKVFALTCLVVGAAFAAQDTTPPVLSLTLHSTKYSFRNCAGAPCTEKYHAATVPDNIDTFQSATCEVGASKDDCPLPECRAYDHHDLYCNSDECRNYNDAQLEEFCRGKAHVRGASKARPANPKCSHEFECKRDVSIVDVDGKGAGTTHNTYDEPDRELRAEYLLVYSQSDRAGNPAEPVSFTMIFQDTQPPSLVTEFGANPPRNVTNNHADREAEFKAPGFQLNVYSTMVMMPSVPFNLFRKFAESCTECMPSATSADQDSFPSKEAGCTAACTHWLDYKALKSVDNYDKDVTSNMDMRISYKGVVVQAWTNYASGLHKDGNRQIDTKSEGDWTIEYRTHDMAGIYGWKERDNYAYQTVTVYVGDHRKPTLYVQEYTGTRNGFSDDANKNPIIECNSAASFKYMDPSPGALSRDLRESWTAAGWQWQNVANADASSIVNLNKVDGAACTKSAAGCYMEYRITYNHNDGSLANNAADAVHRDVRVVDITKPQIVLKNHDGELLQPLDGGKIVNSAGYHSNGRFEGGKGCKFGDKDCLSHTADGTRLLKTGTALDAHCEGNECHTDGFFNYNKLTVGVEDSPKIGWIPNIAAAVGGDDQAQWHGAACTDTCDTTPTLVATLHHGKDCTGDLVGDGQVKNFPEYIAGAYSIKYTCTDGNENDSRDGLVISRCREVENVDHTRPVIQILGAERMTLEATHVGNYVDDGATCYDQVDGVISQNVEVSGDVVDLSKVGKYEIVYHCRDSAGNTAPKEKRTVVIKQTTCPTCKMTNCENEQGNCQMTHEASFQYTDAGATCTDPVDGSLTDSIEVKNPVDVEKTGTYVVTYKVKNSVGRYNDRIDCRDGKQEYMRTVVVKDTLKPVIEIRYKEKLVARSAAKDTAVHNGAENPMGTTVCKPEASSKCGSLTGDALQTYCVVNKDDCHDAGWQ